MPSASSSSVARQIADAEVDPEETALLAQRGDPLALAATEALDDLAHRQTRLEPPEDGADGIE